MAQGDFKRKVAEWARGRNGDAELSRILTNIAILLVGIAVFARVNALSVVALVLLAYAMWRISSKDVAARRRESSEACKRLGPARAWLLNPLAAAKEARSYRHLTCPSCGQRVRVPRGKGRVRVTCPSCHNRFEGRA